MKSLRLFLFLLSGVGLVSGCHRHSESAAGASPDAPAASPAPAAHPLKGVVVDVYREPPALLVQHDEIPGVMAAMTMKFGVDAATVTRVQKGQKIEARLRFQGGKWRLEDVQVVAAP